MFPQNQFNIYSGRPSDAYYDLSGSSTSSVQGLWLQRIGNPAAKWETKNTVNVGIDASFFGGKLDVTIDSVKVGNTYKINNITYKSNSADLTPESRMIVEEFSNYLKDNPAIKIEIHGHTDNAGVAANNLALSTDRAFTVFDVLQQFGIEKERMSYKGFGGTKPVANNATEEGKAQNRRTEFVVISN